MPQDLTDLEVEHREAERRERRRRRDAITHRRPFEGLQLDPEVDFYPEIADREPGDRNIVRWGFDLHPQVTFWAAGILIVALTLVLAFREQADAFFNDLIGVLNTNFGWFYIAAANVFVVACVFFAFSRFGKIRIGGPAALPEFSTLAWFAMLLSAGMGIGLMFWSVAEPVFHFTTPAPLFDVAPGTPDAANAALATTLYHWGIHPWSIYALVSIGLAFFAYNRGLPLTFRSVFYPLLGQRIYGPIGNAIDVLTVLATLCGLASSLGFGAGQTAAGLNFLFGLPSGTSFQVVLIAIITGVATLSVMAGLDGGVKRLSTLNMWIAAVFLLFVIVVGPSLFLLSIFWESLGQYFAVFPELSFYNAAFSPDSSWQGDWTVFYWGWWISWSPFVGMFIARISKGRTVREMVLGVVLVPSLLSVLWMATFGGAAIQLQLSGVVDIATAVNENVATALFEMLQAFPLSQITSLVGVALVVSFFVTSSDSGSLVVDHLTSGGKLDSPRTQRVFWAVMEGLVAAVLLLGGGLNALQTATVTTGLPFAVVLIVMIYSIYTAFDEELDLLDEHYAAAIYRARHPSVVAEEPTEEPAAASVEAEE